MFPYAIFPINVFETLLLKVLCRGKKGNPSHELPAIAPGPHINEAKMPWLLAMDLWEPNVDLPGADPAYHLGES